MTEPRMLMKDIDLHAYVDGELSEAEAREIEVRLATDAKARVVVAALDKQRRALESKFALPLDCPTTHEMAAKVRASGLDRSVRVWRRAALAAVAAAGLIAGVFARELLWPIATVKPSEPAFARAALGAHAVYAPEVRHPVEVAATEEKHLVTWLSKRLGTAVRPPKLTDYGWSLIGGRLIADGERPAAQFMYEDKTGRRMTLFVRPATGLADRAFQFAGTGATASFHWIDGATGYALTGDIERRDLHILARTVHAAIAANGPGMPADAGGDGR